jgi:DNA-binding transcriptional MerR regulator
MNAIRDLKGSERNYKASDALKLAGMTYRQLQDWENRAGVMTSQRATQDGWRKFSGEEILGLCICNRLRQLFSLPLDKVGELMQWLLGKRTDLSSPRMKSRTEGARESLVVFRKENAKLVSLDPDAMNRAWQEDETVRDTIWLYDQLRVLVMGDRPLVQAYEVAERRTLVYLVTDFKEYDILSKDQLANFARNGMLETPLILCPINPIINEVLTAAGMPPLPEPVTPESPSMGYPFDTTVPVSGDELKALNLLRAKTSQSVTLHKCDGEITQAEVEEKLKRAGVEPDDTEILRAIKSDDFSNVSVHKADGKVVGLKRKTTIKLNKVTGNT